GDELAPVQRRDVVPLDSLPQLESPRPVVGARLPGLREVALEREIVGTRRLFRKRIPDEPARGEADELEGPDLLVQAGTDHRRIPWRGTIQTPAALGRLGARGNPIGVGRRRLSRRAPTAHAPDQRRHARAGPAGALDEITPGHAPASHVARSHGTQRLTPHLSGYWRIKSDRECGETPIGTG